MQKYFQYVFEGVWFCLALNTLFVESRVCVEDWWPVGALGILQDAQYTQTRLAIN